MYRMINGEVKRRSRETLNPLTKFLSLAQLAGEDSISFIYCMSFYRCTPTGAQTVD
jgi:hypothetical protein